LASVFARAHSLSSTQSPVRVRVMLALGNVLHEESNVPTAAPIRVVLPASAPDPKK